MVAMLMIVKQSDLECWTPPAREVDGDSETKLPV